MKSATFPQHSFVCFLLVCGLLATDAVSFAQKPVKPPSPLSFEKGRLVYRPDSVGNRIPDFSYCGYKASAGQIPNVDVKAVVPPMKGDATIRIQHALDYVASLPVDASGFRGAVLLQKGTYSVSGQLKIPASGVVLRGSGMGKDGTILIGAGKDRETLIRVLGRSSNEILAEAVIADAYVPVNATKISVLNLTEHGFKTGDDIVISRPSTLAWIKALGTDHFGGGVTALGWKPGERNLLFERRITAANGNTISFDVPITTALDSAYGRATVMKLLPQERIENVGIENLALQSEWDKTNPKDEDHRWMAITLEGVADAWVRQVSFKHFAGSAVYVAATAKRITVEDCKSLQPVSEIGGQRRYTFFTAGQQTLFQRCYAENGYHDFATGFCAPGPNAFVQCHSARPYNFSGPVDSWASGVLFDIVNVDGNAIRLGNRGQDGNGAGWAAANSVLWQCTAARIDCYQPPTAQNYSFGSWAQFSGDGWWESSNEQINPRSLYYTQLAVRLGRDVSRQAMILPTETEASSSPPVDVAMALTKSASSPIMTLNDWIDSVIKRNPISTTARGAELINTNYSWDELELLATNLLTVKDGKLVYKGKLMTGKRTDVQWWSGGLMAKDIAAAKPHLTRFVPGRTGKGLTDDIDSVAAIMQRGNTPVLEHNYGLWYERRRDDHERIRRMDGEVWPPFYELPFARSGKDTAWDGLTKYDLTKYNHWYWNRLKCFADLADENGLLLVHQNYFQHNIIEAGAHYADFPWRTANNINNTGFVEPVNYAGDKRIFYAEQFYDVSNPVRRKLHTAYIRQCLDNFKGNSNVLQLTSAEYTGPLHFVQFWLDVVKAWKKETGKKPLIGLSTTKDVQDSLLADKARADAVDVIDIRYWHYQEDGKVYAPKGGQNLAPRQHARLLKPKRTSFEQVYRAVLEYKQKFPAKAVMYSGDSYDQFGWAVLMAGGSLPVLPKLDGEFLKAIARMNPDASVKGMYVLKGPTGRIVYAEQGLAKSMLDEKATVSARYINPRTGEMTETRPANESAPVVVWLR